VGSIYRKKSAKTDPKSYNKFGGTTRWHLLLKEEENVVTKNEMARAYVNTLENRIEELVQQVDNTTLQIEQLTAHVAECKEELVNQEEGTNQDED
jgi:CII-binding regulator of phage lambda lysogenization HflD